MGIKRLDADFNHLALHPVRPFYFIHIVNSVAFPCLECSYHQQATQGDVTSERPMWAEKGGLDFEGRAKWDAWNNRKVRVLIWLESKSVCN